MSEDTYTINEVSEILGVPVHTVRRMCRHGLVRGLKYKSNGYRVLTMRQIEELRVVAALSKAGVKLPELKRYEKLQRQGKKTIEERKEFLRTKKRQMWQLLKELQEGIDAIERKEEEFDEILSGDSER